jgi:hypothetical protein
MFSAGTDTEFFLENEKNNLVSAIRYIKGGKYDPVPLPSGGGVTYDNVAMEFATPVAFSREEFIEKVRATMREALSVLPENIRIKQLASANFPKKELEHEEARRFGCDPDFDAWKVCVNQVPAGAAEGTFRSAGGHLHIGFMEGSGNEFLLDPYGKMEMVKALDIVLGVPFTLLDTHPSAIKRRKLYGKAGCHRPTDYGVEYRSLSNFWISSPRLVGLVYSLADKAIDLVKSGKIAGLTKEIGQDNIVNTINHGDTKTALSLWNNVISKHLDKALVEEFNACLGIEFNLRGEWGL